MIAALVIVSAVLVVVAGLWLWSGRSLVRRRVRDRVVVTLKSGAAFSGVLYAADRQTWVLRNATAIGAGDRDVDVPVDGEVLVMVADIDFAQRP